MSTLEGMTFKDYILFLELAQKENDLQILKEMDIKPYQVINSLDWVNISTVAKILSHNANTMHQRVKQDYQGNDQKCLELKLWLLQNVYTPHYFMGVNGFNPKF